MNYNSESTAHTKATFEAIPHGVLRRLTSLNSVHEDNENTPLNELYPEHIGALERAGIPLPLPPVYPTLKEAVDKLKENTTSRSSEEEQQLKKKAQKDHKCATYFVMGRSSNFWPTPVCGMISKLVKKHDLP